jgi:GNAT superfamily N-acetyltransferase
VGPSFVRFLGKIRSPMPASAPYTIRPLAPADAAPVQQLWTARFGGVPATQENWIGAALDPSHSAAGLVAVAPPDDTIVGGAFLDVGDRAFTRQYLGLDVLDLTVPLADANGIFHLSCVRADWEGRGIGSAFYERRLAMLARRHVPRAFGIAWHRPAPVDSRTLFEKYGFMRLATADRYYARTGARPNCPVCPGSCTCTASLYGRSGDQPGAP